MQGRITKSFAPARLLLGMFAAWTIYLPRPLPAQNVAAPFYNLPICTANGTQSAPQLIADQARGVFVLWEDARTARAAIYCQRLDSLGHPQWQNHGAAIATTSGKQTRFFAAGDGSGGVLVAWQEVTNDDGDIFAQRFDMHGQLLWGAHGKEVYRGNKEQSAPRVIADGEGGAYIIWHDERSGSQDLIGQRLNAAGEKLWQADGVELVNTRRAQTLGDAVAIPARGFALAWEDESTTPARVLVQHFDPSGKAVWSAPSGVALSTGDQIAPQILLAAAVAGNFALHVAWLDRRLTVPNVYAQRLNAAGESLWGALGVAAGRAAGEQTEMQLLHDGAGGVFITWEDARVDKGDIFAQRLNADGKVLWQTTGTPLAQAEQGQFRARLASDGRGGFIAVWEDERGSGTNIYTQSMNALGQPLWNAEGVVLTNHGKKNSQGSVLMTSPARLWLAWIDERNGSGDIFAQPLTVNGEFDNVPPRILSQPTLQAYVGSPYVYVIEAVDYDSEQAPKLELLNGPAWLQLNQTARKLEGTPSSFDLGEVRVEFHAVDGAGGRALQSFQLQIERDTAAPQILSLPDTLAREDERYRYQIKAADPDPQETLRYRVEGQGNWLTLSSQGELAGTPLNEHVGLSALKITVTNSQGKFAQQQFNLRVQNVNDAPQIVSGAPPRATENVAYVFRFEAADVDLGDSLAFVALLKPAWLQVNANGASLGTPTRTNLADTILTLYVADRAGARDQKTYAIPIDLKNTRPKITSSPKTTAQEDSLYLYQLVIVDPDPNEQLAPSLLQAPAWVQLDSTRRQIRGTPRNEHVGTHTVLVEVRDRRGERDQQQFTLRVDNTNDPPFFISKPDTTAFVDSMYVYQPRVQDLDAGDRVTLSLLAAPAWMTWEAASQTLRGTPTFNNVGSISIGFRAEDAAQAVAVQNVVVRVYDLATPDHAAPASPQNLTITPARWSATPQFTMSWQNPFDPSKIAGAYYKIGDPPDNSRDGTLVKSSNAEPLRELSLQATREGKVAVYLWLVDGRGNVDHATAARADYYYDRTPSQAPHDLRVLNTSGSNWLRGDTLNFVWQPALDTHSGIASYTFNLDEKAQAQLAGTATSFTLISTLKEAAHTCQVVAIDSAGNRRTSLRVSFRVDRTPPRVTHTALDTVALEQALTFRAQANDAASGVSVVRVLYRSVGQTQFNERVMSFENGDFIANLEGTVLHSAGFEYVLSARDSAGNVALSASAPRGVHAVVVQAEHVVAPLATRSAYYQLVAIPYSMKSDSVLSWLLDDFGAYDQTEWRLYSYHPAQGNVEFGRAGFAPFSPGRAFWLVTAKPRSYDLGPTHSVSTAQDFVLELQPGWNLIATPFDFPTDWTAVQKPPLVETQLWTFEGKQYLGNNTVMQPWQGYFVRNLSSVSEKILIPPRCGDCDADLSFSNEQGMTPPSRGELLGSAFANSPLDSDAGLRLPGITPPQSPSKGEFVRRLDSSEEKLVGDWFTSNEEAARGLTNNSPLEGGQGGVLPQRHAFQKLASTNASWQWRLQLHVTNGEFADHENWLGIAPAARMEWDELEWSEPPHAPGNFVALRFNQTTWQQFSGAYTTDFRPPSSQAQSWRFEILSAQAGQRVELKLERNGEQAPHDILILEDETNKLARVVEFDAQTHTAALISFRSTETPRRFVLWAGTQEQLAKHGVAALVAPTEFALSPNYPNPARPQAGHEAISAIRFSLPRASEVDLRIYDMLGRQVRGLILKQFHALGHYEILWDGKDDHGKTVAAGVYLYRMATPNFHATQKMVVLKE